jgi:hypothetical protein
MAVAGADLFDAAVAFCAQSWALGDGVLVWMQAERELLAHHAFGPWLAAEVEDFDERLDFAGYIVRRAADLSGWACRGEVREPRSLGA